MSLKSLWQDKPLVDSLDRITEYIDVSSYPKLRLCAFSDTLTDIHIEWSHDGQTKCISSSIKVASQHWRSEEVKVLMPYLRLHVINNSGAINNQLVICLYHFGANMSDPTHESRTPAALTPAAAPEVEQVREVRFVVSDELPDEEKKEEKKRAWSRFKGSISPKHTCRDDRIPGFLPHGSLLIADKKGNIIPLARGNVNDVLVMGEGGPQWLSLTNTENCIF